MCERDACPIKCADVRCVSLRYVLSALSTICYKAALAAESTGRRFSSLILIFLPCFLRDQFMTSSASCAEVVNGSGGDGGSEPIGGNLTSPDVCVEYFATRSGKCVHSYELSWVEERRTNHHECCPRASWPESACTLSDFLTRPICSLKV
jgi:hypothetical protein